MHYCALLVELSIKEIKRKSKAKWSENLSNPSCWTWHMTRRFLCYSNFMVELCSLWLQGRALLKEMRMAKEMWILATTVMKGTQLPAACPAKISAQGKQAL